MSVSDFFARIMLLSLVSIQPGVECFRRESTENVNFPWICLVGIGEEVVSTCTIVQKTWVVVSVDNFNQKMAGSSKYYYQVVKDLVISAGRKLNLVRKAKRLCVGYISNWDDPFVSGYEENPQSLSHLEVDSYGVALNVGLLELDEPFKWSAYVQPAPLFDSNVLEYQMETQIRKFKEDIEIELIDQTPCVLASWSKSNNSMVVTQAVYVPEQSCKEAYCGYDQANCLKFPKLRYLMCFKSLSFIDMCPKDRGAALYCEHFDKRVVGILTTAINCGAWNLPCVYTSIEFVHRLFKIITKRVMDPGPSKD